MSTINTLNNRFIPPESDEVLLRPDDVAAWINQSPVTLRRWRAEGRGPRFVLIERHPRYRTGDVRDYLASCEFGEIA